jgi:uncharacterized membrane protein YhaH (DUF805 family)
MNIVLQIILWIVWLFYFTIQVILFFRVFNASVSIQDANQKKEVMRKYKKKAAAITFATFFISILLILFNHDISN